MSSREPPWSGGPGAITPVTPLNPALSIFWLLKGVLERLQPPLATSLPMHNLPQFVGGSLGSWGHRLKLL